MDNVLDSRNLVTEKTVKAQLDGIEKIMNPLKTKCTYHFIR